MTITDREVIEEFREQQKLAQTGGRMIGGGAGQSDLDSAGGSSGTGGYGNAQDQQSQDAGPDSRAAPGANPDGLSRGERFDVEQGGGRGPDELGTTNELEEEQRAHQDRGQSVAEEQEESGEQP